MRVTIFPVMPIRIIKLCLAIAIIAMAIYFVSVNNTSTTVTIGAGSAVTASIGTIILSSFALGLLLSFFAASVFAIRSFFREQGFKQRERKRIELHESVVQLREMERAGPSAMIEKRYQKLLKTHPQELLTHLEYIRFLIHHEHRYMEALKHIADAKKTFDSPELYYLTVECHEGLGNKASALEALSVIIHHANQQNPATIRKAAVLSFTLNRFEDTIEYLTRLNVFESFAQSDKQLLADAHSSIIIRDESNAEIRLKKLTDYLSKNDQSAVGFAEASELQQGFGLLNEAAESLMRRFKITGDISSIRSARGLWIEAQNGKAAISAMNSWIRMAATPAEQYSAEIELAKTYILLSQDDEAFKVLEGIQNRSSGLPTELKKEIAILNAMIAYRGRDAGAAQRAFAEVEQLEFSDALPLLSAGSFRPALIDRDESLF